MMKKWQKTAALLLIALTMAMGMGCSCGGDSSKGSSNKKDSSGVFPNGGNVDFESVDQPFDTPIDKFD